MHRDKYNIIGQIQDDGSVEGGDSACWMGHWIYLTGESFPYVKTFEKGFGGYVRHPDPLSTSYGFGSYYKNPWNGCISRDQLTGVLMAVIKQKEYLAMLRIILNHSLRMFLFSYNTIKNGRDPKTTSWKFPDLTIFDIWALMLRGFGPISWAFWPILCLLDCHTLLAAILDRVFDRKESDVINLIGKIMVGKDYIPTPASWIAFKIIDKENMIERLKIYWCGWRDSADFVPHYRKKLKKIKIF